MNLNRYRSLALALLLAAAATFTARAQDLVVGATVIKENEAVPIALSGFSGEVDAVLKFDLYVQGFKFVSADDALFVVSGSNNGRVEARLLEGKSKVQRMGRAYSAGSLRAQAHALADDIVQAVTGKKGISQTKIAYLAKGSGENEVFLADFDGGNAVAVTQDRSLVNSPTWVPGKRVLYYTSYRRSNPDIYSHDLNTGERKTVARYAGSNLHPAISPDGTRMAMILSRNGSPDLYVADMDGQNLKRLTTTKEPESTPTWSPDGKTICYASDVSGGSRLYTISPDGGTPRRLSTVGVGNTYDPDWSPDGKQIVFATQRGGGIHEIYVIPSTGGEATFLAPGEDPSWAPNSRTIIFHRGKGKSSLSVLDVPTKQVKDVTQLLGSSAAPSWAK